MDTSQYRQSIDTLRSRLTNLARETHTRGYRPIVDSTGNRTRFTPGSDAYTRLRHYGERRYLSVCRVMVLMQLLRELEHPASKIEVRHARAYWQSVTGTRDMNACHTCPALLTLDDELPTLFTTNLGMRRHLILAFADCMLMPRWINELDIDIDTALGRKAFAEAARRTINSATHDWQQGVTFYKETMREILGLARDLSSSENQHVVAVQGFYEGMFLTSHIKEMQNYVRAVAAEIGAA